MALAPSVPLGVGFSLEGAFTAKTWQFIVEGKRVVDLTAGVDFTPAEGLRGVFTQTHSGELTPKMVLSPEDGAKDMDVELSAQLYAYAGLNLKLGPGLKELSLLKALTGPKMDLKWEPERYQAARPDFSAVHDLKWNTRVGLGGDAKDAITLLRGVTGSWVNFEDETNIPVDRSPVGALTLSRQRVQAGEEVLLKVAITEASSHFLGIYNIEEVTLRRVVKAKDGSLLLEELPELPAQVPDGEQREFTWAWRPTSVDLGQHTFVAFTRTLLPVFTFEVADNSAVKLVVDQKCEATSAFPLCIESSAYVGGGGAVRLTDDGQVAGFIYENGRMRAATWSWELEHTVLGLLSSAANAQSAAQAISPSGEYVTGWAHSIEPANGGLIDEAFLFHDGRMTSLGTRAVFGPVSQSTGTGVSDSGEVTGDALRHQNGAWESFGWVWSNGALTNLGQLGTSSTLGAGNVNGSTRRATWSATASSRPRRGCSSSSPRSGHVTPPAPGRPSRCRISAWGPWSAAATCAASGWARSPPRRRSVWR